MSHVYTTINSPLGNLKLIASNKGLAAILWENDKPQRVKLPEYTINREASILIETIKQLNEYFTGKREQFNLIFDIQGSDFQKQVWQALSTIPYGKTVCYLDIANTIGKPNAVRAVGAAIGRNPLSIVVPCHRVIGSNNKLTGFAGGLAAKAFLLNFEKVK